MSDSILLDRDAGVLTITLNRPEVFNSFDEEMGSAFITALSAGLDPSVRSVLITGEGKAFCAGEDLKALSGSYESGRAPDLGDILRRRYIPVIEAILSLEKPVVAAVNGVAAGAGVSLALACDYRVMSGKASFVLSFTKAGLIPDAGATWLLPKYLGIGRALDVALTAASIAAPRCLELGLVNEVVEASALGEQARRQAAELAEGPTRAFALTKNLLWRAAGGYLSEHLEKEAQAQGEAGRTNDHIEGVRAFLEKRDPKFRGD